MKARPSKLGISLVIPAYNEEKRLSKSLDSYIPVLEDLNVPFEVIVIADGSDNTPDVARRYHGHGVQCYSFPRKLGRGGAIFEGFKKAKYSVVSFADADGSVPPDDARKVITAVLEGRPCAIASRRLLPDLVAIPEAPHRRFIGFIWHALVRALLGLRVKDAQCGFKVFRQDIVQSVILPKVTVTNRTFEVGMLYHVSAAGYRIEEIPVKYVHDFDTRMPITKAVPIMLLTLLGIFVFNILLKGSRTPPQFVSKLNQRFASV